MIEEKAACAKSLLYSNQYTLHAFALGIQTVKVVKILQVMHNYNGPETPSQSENEVFQVDLSERTVL